MKTRRGARAPSRRPRSDHQFEERDDRRRGGKPQFGRRGERVELPTVFEVEVLGLTEDGEPFAAPLDRRLLGLANRWLIVAGTTVAKGERVRVQVVERRKHEIELKALAVVPSIQSRSFVGMVGMFGTVRVLHRELGNLEFRLHDEDKQKAPEGSYVRVKPEAQGPRGAALVKLLEVLGPNPKGIESLVAIENSGMPVEFPEEALKECEALPAYKWDEDEGRADWRKLPIVTIDGADARDFDDAVYAEPLDGGGHKIIVAIADVAHYLKEGTALDEAARERGNSSYFPDRVVPMLPERLSNDLCSLRPKEDRPVLGVEMEINEAGRLVKHTFKRATIHSAARLTYVQVQAALDGKTDETTKPLLSALKNLEGAFRTLNKARKARGALDLDLPETMVEMNETTGEVLGVKVRERLDSHRLIEELMILANVAAAETLSKKGVPGYYRIHDRPDAAKLQTLSAALRPLGFTVPGPDGGHKAWARLVAEVQEHPASQTFLRQILQSQMQAKYDLENIGHYGLALPLYAHFTSPIRRYADTVVHRALIKALKLPGGGALTDDVGTLKKLGEVINITERRSQQAEWEARDRLMAKFYSGKLGEDFRAIVVGAVTFGVFVATADGAEGLVPARLFGPAWHFSPRDLTWHNRRDKLMLRAGTRVTVRLIEADRVMGRLTFAPGRPDGRDQEEHQGEKKSQRQARTHEPAEVEPATRGRKRPRRV